MKESKTNQEHSSANKINILIQGYNKFIVDIYKANKEITPLNPTFPDIRSVIDDIEPRLNDHITQLITKINELNKTPGLILYSSNITNSLRRAIADCHLKMAALYGTSPEYNKLIKEDPVFYQQKQFAWIERFVKYIENKKVDDQIKRPFISCLYYYIESLYDHPLTSPNIKSRLLNTCVSLWKMTEDEGYSIESKRMFGNVLCVLFNDKDAGLKDFIVNKLGCDGAFLESRIEEHLIALRERKKQTDKHWEVTFNGIKSFSSYYPEHNAKDKNFSETYYCLMGKVLKLALQKRNNAFFAAHCDEYFKDLPADMPYEIKANTNSSMQTLFLTMLDTKEELEKKSERTEEDENTLNKLNEHLPKFYRATEKNYVQFQERQGYFYDNQVDDLWSNMLSFLPTSEIKKSIVSNIDKLYKEVGLAASQEYLEDNAQHFTQKEWSQVCEYFQVYVSKQKLLLDQENRRLFGLQLNGLGGGVPVPSSQDKPATPTESSSDASTESLETTSVATEEAQFPSLKHFAGLMKDSGIKIQAVGQPTKPAEEIINQMLEEGIITRQPASIVKQPTITSLVEVPISELNPGYIILHKEIVPSYTDNMTILNSLTKYTFSFQLDAILKSLDVKVKKLEATQESMPDFSEFSMEDITLVGSDKKTCIAKEPARSYSSSDIKAIIDQEISICHIVKTNVAVRLKSINPEYKPFTTLIIDSIEKYIEYINKFPKDKKPLFEENSLSLYRNATQECKAIFYAFNQGTWANLSKGELNKVYEILQNFIKSYPEESLKTDLPGVELMGEILICALRSRNYNFLAERLAAYCNRIPKNQEFSENIILTISNLILSTKEWLGIRANSPKFLTDDEIKIANIIIKTLPILENSLSPDLEIKLKTKKEISLEQLKKESAEFIESIKAKIISQSEISNPPATKTVEAKKESPSEVKGKPVVEKNATNEKKPTEQAKKEADKKAQIELKAKQQAELRAKQQADKKAHDEAEAKRIANERARAKAAAEKKARVEAEAKEIAQKKTNDEAKATKEAAKRSAKKAQVELEAKQKAAKIVREEEAAKRRADGRARRKAEKKEKARAEAEAKEIAEKKANEEAAAKRIAEEKAKAEAAALEEIQKIKLEKRKEREAATKSAIAAETIITEQLITSPSPIEEEKDEKRKNNPEQKEDTPPPTPEASESETPFESAKSTSTTEEFEDANDKSPDIGKKLNPNATVFVPKTNLVVKETLSSGNNEPDQTMLNPEAEEFIPADVIREKITQFIISQKRYPDEIALKLNARIHVAYVRKKDPNLTEEEDLFLNDYNDKQNLYHYNQALESNPKTAITQILRSKWAEHFPITQDEADYVKWTERVRTTKPQPDREWINTPQDEPNYARWLQQREEETERNSEITQSK